MKKNKLAFKIVGWVVLGGVLFLMYFPLVMVIAYSFSSSKTVGGSGSFTFSLYADLFRNEALMEATTNTLIIGLASSLIATFLGTISAVGIFYLKRGKAIISGMSQITVVNAEIVTAVGFFLLFIFLRDVLHMPVEQGVGWLILAHTMITVPYVVLAVTPRLTQLNPNLFEAGQDLGASGVRTLFTVIVPQLIKGMVSGFALSFTLSLDDFVVTKFNKGDVNTISTYVYDGLKRGLDPAVRALSTILFLSVMVVLVVVNIVGARKAAQKEGGKRPAKKGAKA
ncbi:MAG: ABC transporter permease [Clostridiales bacterium]|nr:ABC transporter permease [Clostridiales bacterium]